MFLEILAFISVIISIAGLLISIFSKKYKFSTSVMAVVVISGFIHMGIETLILKQSPDWSMVILLIIMTISFSIYKCKGKDGSAIG